MPGETLRFDTGVATDVGCRRDANEDSCLVNDAAGVWAVADGMGGHEGGAFASGTVVEMLREVTSASSAHDLLAQCRAAIDAANAHIRDASGEGVTIGTTVVALLAHRSDFACMWSGDSRLYLLRDGSIQQWTRDHTEVQDLLSSGAITAEQARTWPRRNVVTRALGVLDVAELEVRYGTLRPGDTFVLCSDGLYNHVEDPEILAFVGDRLPQQAADFLVRATVERGASDNVTVLVVRCLVAREPTVVLPVRADAAGDAAGR